MGVSQVKKEGWRLKEEKKPPVKPVAKYKMDPELEFIPHLIRDGDDKQK